MLESLMRWICKIGLRRALAEVERSQAEQAAAINRGDFLEAATLRPWIAKCKAEAAALQQQLNELN